MATADEYADWIVRNADKRGTPEFDTVAQAYELAKSEESQRPAQPRTAAQSLGRQVGLTARAGLQGVGSLAGIVTDPIASLLNTATGGSGPKAARARDLAAQLADTLGLPSPETVLERIVGQGAEAMAGAGGTVAAARGVAGATQGVAQQTAQFMAAQPAAQIAGGAGAGVAGQAAQEAGATPAGQIGASLAGGVLGARIPQIGQRVPAPGLQATTQQAEQRGIPVLTSDVSPPQTFMGNVAQRTGERIPIAGTGPVRAAQQQARIDAVKTTLREFGADDAANISDDIMADLARTRGAALTKYTTAKNEVINRLGDAGTVPVDNTVRAIDDQIAKLQSLRTEQTQPVIRVLEDWKTAIQGQSLPNIETLRKQVGEAFTAPELSAIRGTGEKALSAIYGPLKQDMEAFIKAAGERRDVTKWQVANKRLSEMAGDLEMTTLKSVLRSGNATPEDVNKLLFSKKPSEIRQLHANLSPQGQANARTAILARAADDAVYQTEDGTRLFSPERFNAAIKRLQPQIGIFFKGRDLEQVEGLSRALTLTRRASQAGVTTATGQEAAPFVAGGVLQSLVGSFAGAVALAGSIGGLARVYESAPVRNLMLRLGKTAPGSVEEQQIAKRLLSTFQAEQDAINEQTRSLAGQETP